MFRRITCTLTLLSLLWAVPPLFSQEDSQYSSEEKPVVGILAMRSEEESGIPPELYVTIYNILSLTLAFMEDYELKEPGAAQDTSPETLRRICDSQGIDSILFGDAARVKNEGIEVQLKVYDRGENRITHEVSGTAENLLDIFDTVDGLVVDIVEDFSDIRVTYGSLTLRCRGLNEEMNIYIDDRYIDSGTRSIHTIERMVTGEHTAEIRFQDGENNVVLVTHDFSIRKDSSKSINLSVPLIETDRAKELRRIDRAIAEGFRETGDAENVRGEIRTALSTIAGSEFPGAAALERKYRSWERLLEELPMAVHSGKGFALEEKEENRAASFFSESRKTEQRKLFSRSDTFAAFSLSRAKALLPYRSIEVDGDVEDWEGITPIFTDLQDSLQRNGLNDIRRFYLAMDNKYTYMRADFYKGYYHETYFNLCLQIDHRIDLILQGLYDEGIWKARLGRYGEDRIPPMYIYIAKAGDETFEARFSNEKIRELLDSSEMFARNVDTGTFDRNGLDRQDIRSRYLIYEQIE